MKPQGMPAIITGGASGLGEATARALAKAGAKVAILDLNEQAAAKVAGEIGGIAVKCDVTEAASTETAIKQAADRQGPARIAVNCAGVGYAERIVGRNGAMPLENFTKVVNINLFGSFNVMRVAATAMSTLPPLEDNERGIIVNTASVAAYEGQVGQAAYAASKGAVVSMTLPAAREFARFGVRVNTIAPGIFFTPMLYLLPKEAQESLAAAIPFPQRLGKPEEFAALALHMVENVMLNGETVRLDGAIRMAPR